jgi:hypothetical protein
MPDAGPLDPRCELTADLLGDLGSDPVAEEGGDVFGFDSEDGLPGKLGRGPHLAPASRSTDR